jgi:hypothetical protein
VLFSRWRGRAGLLRAAQVLSQALVAVSPKLPPLPPPAQVMVLEQLLKCIREQEPTDKVVLVSNYTQALDLLQKVRAAGRGCRTGGSAETQGRLAAVSLVSLGCR